jgi:transposase-like protein
MSEETVAACPECGTARIETNSTGSVGPHNPDAEQYRCHGCGATFDEYEERPARSTTNTHHGPAKDLLEADPDEYPK